MNRQYTIDRNMSRHTTQKGLIMTASLHHVVLIEKYVNAISRKQLLVVTTDLVPIQAALEIAEDRPNLVFLSSSMHTGVDLAGQLSEIQIIAKVPCLPYNEPIVKYNWFHVGNWYEHQAAIGIIQRLGCSAVYAAKTIA